MCGRVKHRGANNVPIVRATQPTLACTVSNRYRPCGDRNMADSIQIELTADNIPAIRGSGSLSENELKVQIFEVSERIDQLVAELQEARDHKAALQDALTNLK